MPTERAQGRILRIPVDYAGKDKGYMFIRGSDGRDYFVHSSEINCDRVLADLQAGEAVEFDPLETPKGLRGNNVTVGTERKLRDDAPAIFDKRHRR